MAKKVKVSPRSVYNLGKDDRGTKLFVSAKDLVEGNFKGNNQQKAKGRKIRNRIEI